MRLRGGSDGVQVLLGIGLIAVSTLVPVAMGAEYWTHNFVLLNLFIAVAVLQNFLLSDAGQVSFGQGAVFGISAYTVGIVSGLWGYNYVTGMLAGIAAATGLGLCFAGPALRVQGYYLGFVTLSAALVFPEMLVAFNDLTNGINGIARPVPDLVKPLVGGLSWLTISSMALACLALAGHAWVRRLRMGRALRASAISPEAASALGWSPGALRFLAFMIVSVGTGLAGALYVPVLGFVSPYAFRIDLSIYFFFSVIVGGQGRILGPVLGAWVLYLVPNALLVDLANYRLLGYGVIVLAIMLAFPDGLVGTIENALRTFRLRLRVPTVSVQPLLAALQATNVSPRATSQDLPIVEAANVRKAYGSMVALDGVTITVRRGVVHGLVGPNGSGKTTLLNVLSGFVRADDGKLTILGKDVTRTAAHQIARLGVGRTFQTPRVFEEMSVWDNIQLGEDQAVSSQSRRLLQAFSDERVAWEQHRPDLTPHAQRRLLEILRVVAMDADILLLDEPAAGLSPDERRNFVSLIEMLRDRMGKTIVLVEHDLRLVWSVADHVSVLDAGRIIADGRPEDIMNNPQIQALFTGRRADAVEANA